jgi:diguanylate cyclase (GGDEF)-like protein
MLASGSAGIFCLLTAVELRRGRAERRVSRGPAVVLLGAYAALYGIRIPLAAIMPAPPAGFNPLQSTWLAVLCLAGLFFTLATAFVFMALTKERAERLQRHAAETDPLTGIANRRAFVSAAGQQLSDVRRSATLLLFDLDHFKGINDRFGHAVGDGVLVGFCHTVDALLPDGALFGRLGGEEFACLLGGLSRDEALSRGELIRNAVERLVIADLPGLSVTVSIGAAACDGGTGELDTLLRRADMALYRAKGNGRNRVEIAPELKTAA